MSVLDRAALEDSPLADLHAIASELSIDGYRRLRRERLVDAILGQQEGDEAPAEEEPPPRPRRGRRAATRERAEEPQEGPEAEDRRRAATRERAEEPQEGPEAEDIVEGEVEVLPNGSGFLRMHPPEPSDDDVYISAAQVRRCELISGDRIAGPRRAQRRSDRFASLHRVDTINGRPASELADQPHFDERPAAFPQERFELGSEDATLQAIERLTPIGKGSRVTIAGQARSGKSVLLRRLAATLAGRDDVRVLLVLAGVRPEELADWPVEPVQAVSFAASTESQDQAVASVIDQARRVAARGGDAILLLDTLDGLRPHQAHKALATARNLSDGGSLTVIATASAPLGGETTVIALDAALTATHSFPALDLGASGTIRPELLVGEDGAAAIASERQAQ